MSNRETRKPVSRSHAAEPFAEKELRHAHYAHEAVHSAEHVHAKTKKTQKKKRRSMNGKERIGIVLAIAAAVFLCLMMVLNMKRIPAPEYDRWGRVIEPVHKISIMEKFRRWQPFIEIDGELESKEYSMAPKEEAVETPRSMFDDGLDLDQIQEGQFAVLFLGTDESRSNTDVIMLVMFDIRGNQIHILQIPRDTFVPGFTSFEACKLNSVYTLGNADKAPVQRVVDCLETTFRIPIDRYVTTSCSDIGKIVDMSAACRSTCPTISSMKQVRRSKRASRCWTAKRQSGWSASGMTIPRAISAE